MRDLARILPALLLFALVPAPATGGSDVRAPFADLPPVAAGIAPDQPLLYLLDRSDEFFARTLFTLGVPSLRLHALLQHAFERLAELALLERRGTLTVARADRQVRDLRVLFAGATRSARRAGAVSPLAVRKLAASELLEAFAEELETSVQLGGSPAGEPPEELRTLQDAALGLAADLASVAALPSGARTPAVATAALAAAERSLLRGGERAADHATAGRLVLGAEALRARAAALLGEGRGRLEGGDVAGALVNAETARRVIARLRDPALVFDRAAMRVPAERARAEALLGSLVASGLLTAEDVAGVRAALLPAEAPP